MASRIELATEYIGYQRDQKLDEMLAMLADDVVLTNPMTGAITGKAAVEQQMRNRPAGAGSMTLSWSEPEEDGAGIKVLGSGSPFGTIKVVLEFNADDKINKIDIGLAG
ncbi:MAG: nuclear transport factor 2 family protein [Dehalococcoidia bacterium]